MSRWTLDVLRSIYPKHIVKAIFGIILLLSIVDFFVWKIPALKLDSQFNVPVWLTSALLFSTAGLLILKCVQARSWSLDLLLGLGFLYFSVDQVISTSLYGEHQSINQRYFIVYALIFCLIVLYSFLKLRNHKLCFRLVLSGLCIWLIPGLFNLTGVSELFPTTILGNTYESAMERSTELLASFLLLVAFVNYIRIVSTEQKGSSSVNGLFALLDDSLITATMSIIVVIMASLIVINMFNDHPLVHLHREFNIPTWFSSMIMYFLALISLINGYLAREIHNVSTVSRYTIPWGFLTVFFLYVSVDEVVGIHEGMGSHLASFINVPSNVAPWLFFFVIPIVGILVSFIVFFIQIFKENRRLLILSVIGIAFWVVALTAEFLGYNISGKERVLMILEEGSEMLGAYLILLSFLLFSVAQRRKIWDRMYLPVRR